jgi:hypothetical protein
LRSSEGHIEALLQSGKSDDALIEESYLLTLSRFPTSEEKAALRDLLASGASRREAFEDLFWALIASTEFSTNH